MLVKPLPLSWLIHNITYNEYASGRDEWGNDVVTDPIEITNVRYDDGSNYTSGPQEENITNTGIIFIDYRNSKGLPSEFKEKSKVIFNGKELTVTKVVTCFHPQSNTIHHYELEVV